MENKRGEQPSSNNNKILIKDNYTRKLNELLSQDTLEDREVYCLIKNFFKEYLDLNYEFTSEEIKKELKHVYFDSTLKEKVSLLFDKLAKIEYLSQPISKQELTQLLTEFKSIIDHIVIVHYKEKSSFMNKIKDSIQTIVINHNINTLTKKSLANGVAKNSNKIDEKQTETKQNQKQTLPENKTLNINDEKSTKPEKENIPDTKPNPLKVNLFSKKSETIKETKDNLTNSQESQSQVNQIKEKITLAKKIPKKDFPNLKSAYIEILNLYNQLDDANKNIFFKDIQKIYQKLRKAK